MGVAPLLTSKLSLEEQFDRIKSTEDEHWAYLHNDLYDAQDMSEDRRTRFFDEKANELRLYYFLWYIVMIYEPDCSHNDEEMLRDLRRHGCSLYLRECVSQEIERGFLKEFYKRQPILLAFLRRADITNRNNECFTDDVDAQAKIAMAKPGDLLNLVGWP
jgi:hypothetical protein